MNEVEIYIRPSEGPPITVEPQYIRIFYNGKWIDFRDGEVLITLEPLEPKKKAYDPGPLDLPHTE